MKDFDPFITLFLDNPVVHLINTHIIESEPEKAELYSKVNFILYGRWIKFELGEKREIVGTTQGQIMTFSTNNIIFETILN